MRSLRQDLCNGPERNEEKHNDARCARMTPALYEIGVQELAHARHVQQIQTMMMARARPVYQARKEQRRHACV